MAVEKITVRVADADAFKVFLVRVRDFIDEFAWHTPDCAAINADGDWRIGNPNCTCGYDKALGTLLPDEWTA